MASVLHVQPASLLLHHATYIYIGRSLSAQCIIPHVPRSVFYSPQIAAETRPARRFKMGDKQDLAYGLCTTCFRIDFDSPDLRYTPRLIADVVSGCSDGCTFCGLLTYSLDLKSCMVDAADGCVMHVSLSRQNGHCNCNKMLYMSRLDGVDNRGCENQDCIIAELSGYKEEFTGYREDWRANLDITMLHGESNNLEGGKA